jgi:hypothetical protein
VTVDGATFTTNSAGQVTLPQRPVEMAPIDILAEGFLDRLTVFRVQETRLSLWPRTSPTGLTETDTMSIVYTESTYKSQGPLGADSLRQRYSRAPVQVFFSDGFEDVDSEVIDIQDAAVAELNEAIGGGLTYLPPKHTEIPPADMGELHVVLTLDPTHEACLLGSIVATADHVPPGITSGTLRINYCSISWASDPRAALHELAHTFGLRHSRDAFDLMHPLIMGPRTFSPKERLLIRLMLQRRPGNIFPDTDACRWRPSWCLE